MNELAILELLTGNLEVAFTLALPLAGTAMLIGLVSSLFQSATSIQEPNLSLVPKLLGVAAVACAMGPWMIHQVVQYTASVYSDFTRFIH